MSEFEFELLYETKVRIKINSEDEQTANERIWGIMEEEGFGGIDEYVVEKMNENWSIVEVNEV